MDAQALIAFTLRGALLQEFTGMVADFLHHPSWDHTTHPSDCKRDQEYIRLSKKKGVEIDVEMVMQVAERYYATKGYEFIRQPGCKSAYVSKPRSCTYWLTIDSLYDTYLAVTVRPI